MSNFIKSWNNRSIRIRPESRYVSLTDMAMATDTRVNNWTQLKSTKSYVETLATVTGISATDLIQTVQGGTPELQGTWGHPKIALRFAQWCNDAFAVQVDCWIDELLTTGSISLADKPKRPYFYDRLQLFQERTGKIPAGYFCIFEETTSLVSNLERHGYNLPDDAIIDISIGKLFCKYLRQECNIEPNDVCLQYPHWYPGHSRPVQANLYPFSLLETFRSWLEYRYYSLHIEKYFKTRKDAPAIEAVRKFLGLLPPG